MKIAAAQGITVQGVEVLWHARVTRVREPPVVRV